jgi:endonuclease IV
MKNFENLYVSSSCLKKQKSLEVYLNIFLSHNIRNVELSGIHNYENFQQLKKKINYFKRKGMKFTFHNYFPAPKKEIVLNLISRNKNNYLLSEKLIKNSLKLAYYTGVNIYGFHPGYLKESYIKNNKFYFKNLPYQNYERSYQLFIDRLVKILNKNKKYLKKVQLSLENLFPLPRHEKMSLMNNFDEIEKIFDLKIFKQNKLKLLLDLGHLEISSNLLKFDKNLELDKILKKYKNRINEVHLSGNNLIEDLHLRVKNNPWQLEKLKLLKKKLKKKTIYVIESRNLKINQIVRDYETISKILK